MTKVHENGENPVCRNRHDYAMVSNQNQSTVILLTAQWAWMETGLQELSWLLNGLEPKRHHVNPDKWLGADNV